MSGCEHCLTVYCCEIECVSCHDVACEIGIGRSEARTAVGDPFVCASEIVHLADECNVALVGYSAVEAVVEACSVFSVEIRRSADSVEVVDNKHSLRNRSVFRNAYADNLGSKANTTVVACGHLETHHFSRYNGCLEVAVFDVCSVVERTVSDAFVDDISCRFCSRFERVFHRRPCHGCLPVHAELHAHVFYRKRLYDVFCAESAAEVLQHALVDRSADSEAE